MAHNIVYSLSGMSQERTPTNAQTPSLARGYKDEEAGEKMKYLEEMEKYKKEKEEGGHGDADV